MQRLAVPLLIAGAAGVLIALVLVKRSLSGGDTEPAPAVTRPEAPATTREGTPASPAPAAPRAALPPMPGRPAAPAPTTSGGGDAPQLAGERPPRGVLTDDNLEYGMAQLGDQVAAVEPLVAECVRRTTAAGQRLSGRAELTFIIAQRTEQVVLEDTGIDAEQTTIDHAPLIECLHETTRAMKFKGLPRNAAALIVTRRVDVADGALVNNSLVKFSYIR